MCKQSATPHRGEVRQAVQRRAHHRVALISRRVTGAAAAPARSRSRDLPPGAVHISEHLEDVLGDAEGHELLHGGGGLPGDHHLDAVARRRAQPKPRCSAAG
jgi:hypothetical protein